MNVSTHVHMSRATNEILCISYHWYEKINMDMPNKIFNSFESLNTFINELIDLKNEYELNSLESQSYEG